MPAADTEKNLLDQITGHISTLSDNFNGKVEALRKEINSGSDTKAAEIQAELDKNYGPQISALVAEQKRLMKLIASLEAGAAAGAKGGRAAAEERRSVAGQFLASAGYTEGFLKGAGRREYIPPVEVRSFWRETKASIAMDSTNYGAAVAPLYIAGVLTHPKRLPIMRSICEVIPVTATNSVVMNREVAEYDHAAKLTANANIGVTSLTVTNAAGFRTVAPFNELTLNNGSATEIVTISAVNTTTNVLTVSATTITMVAGDLVSSRAYGTTPEGLLAPSSFESLEQYIVAIARLATQIKVEMDVLSDVNQAESFINDRLLARHGRNEDINFLYGDGSTNKIRGIFNDSAVPTLTYASGTLLDFLIDASYDLAYEDYVASAFVVSPQAHKKVVKTKDSTGAYIYLPSAADQAPDRVYAVPFKWSNQLVTTHGITGDFTMGAKILDRLDATIEVGTVDDDFSRNRRTVIAAARVGFGIPLPRALRRLANL